MRFWKGDREKGERQCGQTLQKRQLELLARKVVEKN